MISSAVKRNLRDFFVAGIIVILGCCSIPVVVYLAYFLDGLYVIPIHDVPRVLTLDELVQLPEEEIDLFQAALLLSREIDPDVDVEAALDRLDAMAHTVIQRVGRQKTTHGKLSALAQYLFQEQGFEYAHFEDGDQNNFRPDRTLETNSGDCLTFSLLYHGLAKRLGIPLQTVITYGRYHVFLYCGDSDEPFYIESTIKSGLIHDVTEFCQEQFFGPHERLDNRQSLSVIVSEMANYYHYTQRDDLAIQTYLRALKHYPENVIVHSYLGILHPDLDQAIEFTRKSTQLNPNYAIAFYHDGLALQTKEQYEPAIKAYRKALQLDPKHKEALNNLGICLGLTGDLEQARQCYLDVIDLDPHFVPPYFNLGCLYARKEEYIKAAPYFQQTIDRDVKYVDAYKMLIKCLWLTGQKEKVIEILEQALEHFPDHPTFRPMLEAFTKEVKLRQRAVNPALLFWDSIPVAG